MQEKKTAKKEPLIILTGPTAVGKTALSIALAKKINGEIISADSMQVYKKMNIGTAKIREEEKEGIPHYLIDVIDPKDEFNVVEFQKMAKEAIKEIRKKGKIPIVVGGTGFYIQALLYDINFEETQADQEFRKKLEKIAQEKGSEFLHEELKKVDLKSAQEIHHNNVKKVIRALEYYHLTNTPISKHNEEERKRESIYNFAYFVLTHNREILYQRINQRIDLMLEEGLLDEVKQLKEQGYNRELVSMQGLGYKEILAYFDKELTLEEAIYLLKRDTRRFAKRQLTWFRREKEVIWLDKQNFGTEEEILKKMIEMIEEKNIL